MQRDSEPMMLQAAAEKLDDVQRVLGVRLRKPIEGRPIQDGDRGLTRGIDGRKRGIVGQQRHLADRLAPLRVRQHPHIVPGRPRHGSQPTSDHQVEMTVKIVLPNQDLGIRERDGPHRCRNVAYRGVGHSAKQLCLA